METSVYAIDALVNTRSCNTIARHLQSGNSVIGLSVFLKRRTISAREAAVQKYCCFKRSSFPTICAILQNFSN